MKIDKFLILMILSILALFSFTYWQFKKLSQNLTKFEIPKVEIPKPEELFEKEIKIKEFISPDEKVKFKYLSDWIEMPKETWQKEIGSDANLLFFANKFKLEKVALGSLIFQEFNLVEEKTIEKIVEETKKEIENNKGEVLESEIIENQGYLKAKIKKEEKGIIIFAQKIILLEKKVYLLTIFSLENSWPEFEKEANEILNSVELK